MIVACGVGWWLFRPSHHMAHERARAEEDPTEVVEPARPPRVIRSFESTASATTSPMAKVLPATTLAISAAAPKESVTPVQIRDSFEMAFTGDHTDPSLDVARLRAARGRIEAALPSGSTLRDFGCRASMCRIETSHTNISHYHEFIRAAFNNPDTEMWNAATFSTRLNDGAGPGQDMVMVSFVAREGQDLPNVE